MNIEQLRAFRREIHRHPEPAFTEVGTAARIEASLAGLPVHITTGAAAHDLSGVINYPSGETMEAWAALAVESGVSPDRAAYFRDNGTALVVDLLGNRPGPNWGLRVDIDALPMHEADQSGHFPADEGFNSTVAAMHACGHDVHATIGVGLLHRLADKNFGGSLRVFFQPAEEGVRGAQTMIDAGVIDGVERMLAIHVAGDMAVGEVVGSFTGGMATRKLLVNFTGEASHAAGAPEAGRNALMAAATAALGIMGIPRFSTADTRLNVGTLNGGDGVNIVPSSAEMTCEARATNDDVVEEVTSRIKAVVAGASLAHGVDHTIAIMGQSATVQPDEELIDLIVGVAEAHPDVQKVHRTKSLAGSDDANLMIRHVQQRNGLGAYLMVGAASPGPHHSATFNPDEQTIPLGIDILEALLRAG
jgi:aminobenzoyl-glutamate utilization protein A